MRSRSFFFGFFTSLFLVIAIEAIWHQIQIFHRSRPIERNTPNSVTTLETNTDPKSSQPTSSTPAVDPCQSIYHLVCQKPGVTRDPTGWVYPDIEGERQAVRLYEDIIHKHRNWTVQQVDEE